MAVVVCCPCGNPIDSEHLDLVVSLTCPQCSREIDIEIDNGPVDRRRAMLTVMEGPHWVGERFIIPVGVDLKIGQANGNWISLDDESISGVHCRLRLNPDGALIVEDHQGSPGTFIGTQRIERAKLSPKQSLRIGTFRLRLDYQTGDGSTITANVTSAFTDTSGLLPTMVQVRAKKTLGNQAVSNRFPIARWLMISVTWLLAAYHFFAVHQADHLEWRWPVAAAAALVLGGSLTLASRRVTLAHQLFKYTPLAMLLALAIVDLVWSMPVPASCAIAVAGAVACLIVATPPPTLAIGAIALGESAVVVMLVATIMRMTAGN
ncbi:MAG: FHA domain-containing protein [Planctomycetota bacterium]